MLTIAIIGWLFIIVVALYQFNVAAHHYSFTIRQTHGKRCVYVRSKTSGRVVMQTRNIFDILSLGIQ